MLYKQMKYEADDPKIKEIYDNRQSALKWILVTSFGYLGYKNARFGKVDAHIAVCAFARDALLKTAHISEKHGFEIIHGIVDSLWLKKENASPRDYVELAKQVSKEIGVPLNVEGSYRWIVFLPSRMHSEVPVLNRYYGVFESGKIKVKGIEAKRRDTASFIRDAQIEMIKTLAKAPDAKTFREKIPEALKVLKTYLEKISAQKVELNELLIAKQLSMHPNEYSHNVFTAIAAWQLMKEGVEISAGQTVKYLITDADNRRPERRVSAAQLITLNTRYDPDKYAELLILAAENILSPFGFNAEKLRSSLIYNKKQLALA